MGNTNNSFSFLLIFLFLSISSTSSLPTFSISETSNQTLVCALVYSPERAQSSINCSSFPAGIQIQANPDISFSALVAGDGFLCALRFESAIYCWRFSINGTVFPKRIRPPRGPSLTQFEAGNSHLCGLINGTNTLECWQGLEFNTTWSQNFRSIAVGNEFVCGLSEIGEISCLDLENISSVPNWPAGNFSVIAAGFRHACAINSSNDLVCWGDVNAIGVVPPGKFTALALGENRNCALRTNETVVCWGQNDFRLPETLLESNFITIEAKRSVFCGVVKSNFSLFCWGNEIFNSNSMVFSDVVPGTCRRESECTCGQLAGSGRFCGGGRSICQSCLQNSPPLPQPPALPPPPPPSPQPDIRTGGVDWSRRLIVFLVVGCVGSFSLLLVIGFFLFRYFKGRGCSRVHDSGRLDEIVAEAPPEHDQQQLPPVLDKRLSQLTSIGTGSHLEEFPLEILLQATNNFSEENQIGTGSFGSVYRATLDDGREVAVKRAEVSTTSSHVGSTKRREDRDLAFVNELESLSRLHHKNLVRLLGFCEESDELVLVYEYMSNGTLHDHLHKLQDSPLASWVARIKVALDAARGIQYLHEYAVPSIIHRDIKSSNILLDDMWTAKVSDFGLSLIGPEDQSHLSLRAAGTVGYIDPEYYRLQQLTTKSDVYSFGVVLLEMLSGYKAIHRNENGNPRNVVDFMMPYITHDEIHRVLDRNVPPPTPFEIEAVTYVGYVASDCVNEESRGRPSMTEIVNSLERALQACLIHPSFSRSTTDRESVQSL